MPCLRLRLTESCGPRSRRTDDPDHLASKPHPATAVSEQAEAGELPVAVLGVVGQQSSSLAPGGPAGEVDLLPLVFAHHLHCARRPLGSPPCPPMYVPPPSG